MKPPGRTLKNLGTYLKRLQPPLPGSYNKAQQLLSNKEADKTLCKCPVTIKTWTDCLAENNEYYSPSQHNLMFMFNFRYGEQGSEFDNGRFCLMEGYMKTFLFFCLISYCLIGLLYFLPSNYYHKGYQGFRMEIRRFYLIRKIFNFSNFSEQGTLLICCSSLGIVSH